MSKGIERMLKELTTATTAELINRNDTITDEGETVKNVFLKYREALIVVDCFSCTFSLQPKGWFSHIHFYSLFVQRIGVEHVNGFFCFASCAHRNKGKSFRLTVIPVCDEIRHDDIASLGKQVTEFFSGSRFWEVAYV